MRIFYAADTSPNAYFQSNIWRNNLYEPLVDMGHDIVEFDYDLRETFRNLDPTKKRAFVNRNRPKLEKALIGQIKKAHAQEPIDLFFSYFYSACARPSTIKAIKSIGIITVNWYCNGAHQFHLIKELAPAYDWCLVPEKFRLEDYRRIGANPIYCQEAANPTIYKPYDVPVEFNVTFVGQAYGERPEYIKYLLDCGIDVKVWGQGWEKYIKHQGMQRFKASTSLKRISSLSKNFLTSSGWRKLGRRLRPLFTQRNEWKPSEQREEIVLPSHMLGGILTDEEMVQMYSRSKINLGFSICGDTHKTGEPIKQVRLRDFEVPMSGGFYIVMYMEELESLYQIGKEIVCYTDKEDLAEKIRYYLENDEEREKIRRAGYFRCQKDHTWHKRFKDAFNEMGLC